MSSTELSLALSVFLACAVEAVEAFTIVLAVSVTRSRRAALAGTGAAVLVLAGIVGALGPAVVQIPIDAVRLLVGVLLLAFGVRWLRKAILRSAGRKAKHDELEAFERETEAARAAGGLGAGGLSTGDLGAGGLGAGGLGAGFDGYSFAVAFKGVLLEGVEVVFIVLTLGAGRHDVGLAAAAAGLAVLVVVAAGVAVHAPLARVPENAMKFAVGVMLSSFGVFWLGEGAGVAWPGGDASLPALVGAVLLGARATVWALRRSGAGSFDLAERVEGQAPAGDLHAVLVGRGVDDDADDGAEHDVTASRR